MTVDVYFDTARRDIAVDDGDMREATPIEEVAQRVWLELDSQRGEWVFDQRRGFPWQALVFVKAPRLRVIEAEIRRVVLAADERVLRIEDMRLDYDPARRTLAIAFRVVASVGEVVVSGGAGETADEGATYSATPAFVVTVASTAAFAV